MPRPVHFEIHCEDLDRAQAFYEALFGWSFQSWPGVDNYRMVTTGPDSAPGIDGGLIRRVGGLDKAAPTPVIAWVCTVDVDNIDAYFAKALQLGAQEALPKQAAPGIGWYAYCKDPEGNIFGMMQRDPGAR